VERLVGFFVSLATVLLLAGFCYYLYHTAKRKGWLVTKVPYYTLMSTATGLKVGDPIRLMGFDAGEITRIEPMPPDNYYNVYIAFVIKEPYFGYIWTDSEVRVGSADLLGNRFLEVTKGGTSGATNYHASYQWDAKGELVMWIDPEPERGVAGKKFVTVRSLRQVEKPFKGYLLIAYESEGLSEQLNQVIRQVENALPNVLRLTNQVTLALSNIERMASNADLTVTQVQPILTNLAVISEQLREPQGSLGKWLLPPHLDQQIQTTLSSANATLQTADTNLSVLAANLNRSLENLAQITGNLNAQVQANSMILSDLSSLVLGVDELIQGLQRHWLLKGAFRPSPTTPPRDLTQPTVGGQP
jgi:ABC-type transporter Mla subunit MlaD